MEGKGSSMGKKNAARARSGGLQGTTRQHVQSGRAYPYGTNQGARDIGAGAGAVVGGDDRVQPPEKLDGEGFRRAHSLLQRLTVADHKRGAGNEQCGEAQSLQVALDFAFDAVIEDARMRIAPHGCDHTTPGGSSCTCRASGGQHGVVVDGAKGALAARCCGDGGAQGDVDIIHRW